LLVKTWILYLQTLPAVHEGCGLRDLVVDAVELSLPPLTLLVLSAAGRVLAKAELEQLC